MIVSVFALFCDGCRTTFQVTEGEQHYDASLIPISQVRGWAKHCGWKRIQGADYCPLCDAKPKVTPRDTRCLT